MSGHLPCRLHRQEPRGQACSGDPGQDLLKGPFHARLVVVLEFVLIADQCEGVRDSKLRRRRDRNMAGAGAGRVLPALAAELTWAGLPGRGRAWQLCEVCDNLPVANM